MNGKSTRINSRRSRTVLAVLMLMMAFLVVTCREKDSNIIGDDNGNNGSWSIALDTSSTLYVPNDTISVRLFDPQGLLATGKVLRFEATVSVDSVVSQVTTRDTLSFPWGSQPAVIYWGTGDTGGQEPPHEMIFAYYIDLQTQDTLAQASRSYQVLPRP